MPSQISQHRILSNDMDTDKISLHDILCFLKIAYKTILVFGVAGTAIAAAYLVQAPKQYEAVAQIAMAKFSLANKNSTTPQGLNIEEPSHLISRLSLRASFPPQVLAACNIDWGANSAAILSKSMKLAPVMGVVNVVELKTFGKTPEAALTCAQSTFELIKTTQAQIIASYIADIKIELADNIERLAKAKELTANVDKSGSAIGAAYLASRDEVRFLLDEIALLKRVVTSNQSGVTRLIAPIYASNTPIAPKRQVILAIGFLGGLFLGLMLVLGRRMWTRLKLSTQE